MKPASQRTCVCLILFLLVTLSSARAASTPPSPRKATPLFDGRTLAGWEGDARIWRVEEGCLAGGSLAETVKQNEFLASSRDFTNFIVRFQIKLTGTNGFINSGFQIRSQRVPNSSEMAGHQCDFGEPDWYGAIYDESRRNKLMAAPDMAALGPVIKRNDWNEYVIRADGPRISTWINGVQGVDFIEPDPAIPDWGKFGIQVHGGGRALVQVRNISVEELPPTPPEKTFLPAPAPGTNSQTSPLTPKQEQASFTLAPGFEIELMAHESKGLGKFVAIDWDLAGRLWTMTALEYPVDANESPAEANALYTSKARDKVLVFDRDAKSPTGYAPQPRVFADGLAIPLGILPYKNGAYVQHGTEIVFLSDTDGDGRADKREVILSGFGIQDSHLFPHQFTRAPGNWIWMAQGAFNYGKVRSPDGKEQQFDQTRMARFRYDGTAFDITSQGPCNIWGLVINGEGEAWIQEANDYGYPTMPFHLYANYPGCSDSQFKSYAPEFPGTAPDFKMGGTGLSGLALSDKTAWPEPYADVMYVANPITRKIQAIKTHRDGPRYHLQLLGDFVQSSDEWFRPIALRLGPDGGLYLVDWYNKIISHNEVPRNHPERDKKRGRIWRVKHKDQKLFPVPDFNKVSGNALLAKLGGESLMQSHLAWQAIGDRQSAELAPKLKAMVADKSQPAATRIAALWALEEIGKADLKSLKPLLADANRNIRREAVRALGTPAFSPEEVVAALEPIADDLDPEVRAEVIRTAGTLMAKEPRAVALCVKLGRAPLAEPTVRSTHSGRTIKTGVAYEREFERYLVRLFLEQQAQAVAAFLDSVAGKTFPLENRLLATLALEPKASATRVAQLLPQFSRAPGDEEVLRLAQFPDEPGVNDALQKLLRQPATQTAALTALLKFRTRLDATKLAPALANATHALLVASDQPSLELGARLAGAFKLDAVESDLLALVRRDVQAAQKNLSPASLAALRALREIGSTHSDLFEQLARELSDPAQRNEAVAALTASKSPEAGARLLKLWPDLTLPQRRATLNNLAGSKSGAQSVLEAVQSGAIAKTDLNGGTLDKLQIVLGSTPELDALLAESESLLRPVLRLDGRNESYLDTKLTLTGPFTVEASVKLDEGISNLDGILAAPGTLDLNFHDAQFRAWAGPAHNDIVVAKRKTVAGVWTHYAVTRDEAGIFRIFVNGEPDATSTHAYTNAFTNLDVGRTIPSNGGTAGELSEYRVWNRARTADEIRAAFDQSFADEPRPAGLIHWFGGKHWSPLHGGAKVERSDDFPPVLTASEAKAQAEKFAKYRSLIAQAGNPTRGRELFITTCMTCHTVGGQGGQIGPVLNGAGAMGVDALLRATLTPNAAMEAGYRTFRVELRDGDVLDGMLVSQDSEAIVLRRQNVEDLRVPQANIRRAGFTKMSVMPEGLLETMQPQDVTDLFAYLRTLK
jgi:putative membrane-bound dehydrogenase-like protein